MENINIDTLSQADLLKTYQFKTGYDIFNECVYQFITLFEHFGNDPNMFAKLLNKYGKDICTAAFPDNENILHIAVRSNCVETLDVLFTFLGLGIFRKLANQTSRFNLKPVAGARNVEVFVLMMQFTEKHHNSIMHCINYSYEIQKYVINTTVSTTANSPYTMLM